MILGPAVDVFQNEWFIQVVIDNYLRQTLYESSEWELLSVIALIVDRLE